MKVKGLELFQLEVLEWETLELAVVGELDPLEESRGGWFAVWVGWKLVVDWLALVVFVR